MGGGGLGMVYTIYYYSPLPLNLVNKQQATINNKHFSFLFWLLLRLIAPGSTLF